MKNRLPLKFKDVNVHYTETDRQASVISNQRQRGRIICIDKELVVNNIDVQCLSMMVESL